MGISAEELDVLLGGRQIDKTLSNMTVLHSTTEMRQYKPWDMGLIPW